MNKKMILMSLMILLSWTACSDKGGSSPKPAPNTYTNPVECSNQKLPVGVPGNSACPYQGDYDDQLGYQGYAIYIDSYASVGVGFYIDFGWDYNDMCPQEGQLPVFQDGQFSHCDSVNATFAQTDFRGHTQPNTGECTGDQYMSELTGCRPQFQPSHNTFFPQSN